MRSMGEGATKNPGGQGRTRTAGVKKNRGAGEPAVPEDLGAGDFAVIDVISQDFQDGGLLGVYLLQHPF